MTAHTLTLVLPENLYLRLGRVAQAAAKLNQMSAGEAQPIV